MLGSQGWVSGDLVDAGLGNDPAEDDFGAKRVQAEYIDRGWAWNFEDHIHYYDKDGESLYNVAAIATGQYDQAEFAGHRTDPWYADPVAPELDREPREIHHGR